VVLYIQGTVVANAKTEEKTLAPKKIILFKIIIQKPTVTRRFFYYL
jgi:hypothetical protein